MPSLPHARRELRPDARDQPAGTPAAWRHGNSASRAVAGRWEAPGGAASPQVDGAKRRLRSPEAHRATRSVAKPRNLHTAKIAPAKARAGLRQRLGTAR